MQRWVREIGGSGGHEGSFGGGGSGLAIRGGKGWLSNCCVNLSAQLVPHIGGKIVVAAALVGEIAKSFANLAWRVEFEV